MELLSYQMRINYKGDLPITYHILTFLVGLHNDGSCRWNIQKAFAVTITEGHKTIENEGLNFRFGTNWTRGWSVCNNSVSFTHSFGKHSPFWILRPSWGRGGAKRTVREITWPQFSRHFFASTFCLLPFQREKDCFCVREQSEYLFGIFNRSAKLFRSKSKRAVCGCTNYVKYVVPYQRLYKFWRKK